MEVKNELLRDVVKDINVNANTTIKELIEEFSKIGGFTAKKLWEGVKILEEMFNDKECIKVLSFPACIVSTGLRGLLKEVLKRKMFDLVITTCGTLDHDFARLFSDYYHGFFEADDIFLAERGIHRLGNVFIPKESYGETIEQNLRPILKDIYAAGLRNLGTYELIWEIGKRLENHPNKESSIIYWSYKNGIPMIVPGITDGAFGTQILVFKSEHPDFEISVWKDEMYLSSIFFGDKVAGALMIGGGISKHHTIWWAQFAGGLKYAVYLTTAPEWDGSLSGARTREAISWGKIKKEAKHITIEGEASVLLPLLLGYFL